MKRIVFLLALALAVTLASAAGIPRAAVLIILGQSNADGSAFADSALDDDMWKWYTSSPATSNLHIWYRSAVVHNDTDSLGRRSPHAYDGRYNDMPAGWMQLWYRNNNTGRQTSMNMIHGQGTYSVRSQQRRGIEGEFGRRWALKYPDTELYVIKLGVSGSRIDSWTASFDGHNWRYFIDNIYRPAMESLVNTGRQPYLAGVWWMQGENISSDLFYGAKLPDTVIAPKEGLLEGYAEERLPCGCICYRSPSSDEYQLLEMRTNFC